MPDPTAPTPNPSEMPDLHGLPAAERRAIIERYSNGLRRRDEIATFTSTPLGDASRSSKPESTGKKPGFAPRHAARALDGRNAVFNALLNAGGDFQEPGMPDIVPAAFIADAADKGVSIDESAVWDHLATDAVAMTMAVAATRDLKPHLFGVAKVPHFERMRLDQKVAEIMRSRDNRAQMQRQQDEMLNPRRGRAKTAR